MDEAAMPYKIHPDGTIEADTVDEAIAISARLSSQSLRRPQDMAEPNKPAPDRATPVLSDSEKKQRLVRFLDLIHNAGAQGIRTSKVEVELGLIHGGMGMMGTSASYALKRIGIPKSDVYRLVAKDGIKYLVGGPRLQDAIGLLTKEGE